MIEGELAVSVIIPVFRARRWIKTAVRSLGQQTLQPHQFEVLLVYNGPDDGAADEVVQVSREFPALLIRELTSQTQSAAAARNVGIDYAKGSFITFVDADDWVSPRYLELLLGYASLTTIPVAQIVDVQPDGSCDYRNRFNELILSRDNPTTDPRRFFTPLSFMGSKMYPTEWVRRTLFDESLRSSEDVEFNYRLYGHYNFRFNVFPAAAGAMYFRRRTAHSVSRGDLSKDFLVQERYSVIRALANARDIAPDTKKELFNRPIKAQLNLVQKYYMRASPQERRSIIEKLVSLGIGDIDWSPLQERPRKLVVALNFLPFADTGAIMVAKRIWEGGETVDVISGDLTKQRAVHKNNFMICAPYIHQHKVIKPPIRWFSSKREVSRFIASGLETFRDWISGGREYTHLYSRSMWPHSHFLAAAIKREMPDIHWEAEFSDPLSLTVEGEKRFHPPVSEEIYTYFENWGTQEQQLILENSPYVMRWAELLPYFFADSLIVTNHNQLQVMLEHAPPSHRAEIESKAVIKPHPTLPRLFYQIKAPYQRVRRAPISMAYFGNFYRTRGMSDVLLALNELTDEELSLFSLDIYTDSTPEDLITRVPANVRAVITVLPKLEFLDFLSTMDRYDVLIVNDAATTNYFSSNPYLPSKISDYRGADSRVWAIVEPGSVLSSIEVEYRSRLHDHDDAKAVLRQIIRTSQIVGQ